LILTVPQDTTQGGSERGSSHTVNSPRGTTQRCGSAPPLPVGVSVSIMASVDQSARPLLIHAPAAPDTARVEATATAKTIPASNRHASDRLFVCSRSACVGQLTQYVGVHRMATSPEHSTEKRDPSPLGPTVASGTLSSLFRVLCTLRSLYIVLYRSRVATQPWHRHMCRSSCSPKQLYSSNTGVTWE